jgi:hypothetical protein
MLRHLIGAGFARATTARVVVTDEGRAFLAQLVAPMAARADATIQTSERVRQ